MNNKSKSTPVKAMVLDPLPKDAYTHGLELIYTLQDVDISSVRILGASASPQKASNPQVVPFPYALNREEQLEFYFGGSFSYCIPSFLAKEPVQSLGLTRHAEKALYARGIHTLGAAAEADLSLLGIAQGHADEIRHKIEQYVDGRSLLLTERVDFAAWIRSLAAGSERKKVYAALEAYGLHEVIALSPSEVVEVRRLTPEKKLEWSRQVFDQLRAPSVAHEWDLSLKTVAEALIKPWMHGRLGLAGERELSERWQRIGECPLVSASALNLFKDLYAEAGSLFAKCLISVEEGVYAGSVEAAEDYKAVAACAGTYLIPASPDYPLGQLQQLIAREFAAQWRGFPEGFIEKALSLCGSYRVRKASDGMLHVRRQLRG